MESQFDTILREKLFVESFDQEEIIGTLRKYGICVVRSYIDCTEVKAIADEAMSISAEDNGVKSIKQHKFNPDGLVKRFNTNQLNTDLRLRNVFSSQNMLSLAQSYYRGSEISFNDEIFFSEEHPSDEMILPWHFDRIQSLKFYINLVDVDDENGAFRYSPGSHREGDFRANNHRLKGGAVVCIPNDLPEDEVPFPITISAKAGDLVIFDAAGFHCGGVVKPGRFRRVIRAHTHLAGYANYQAPRFMSNAWLGSVLRKVVERFFTGVERGRTISATSSQARGK